MSDQNDSNELLKESIRHWTDNVRTAEEGNVQDIDTTCATCPLCKGYAGERSDTGMPCYGCPISAYTGYANCVGSPYYDVYREEDADSMRLMRNWLLDLLEDREPEVDEYIGKTDPTLVSVSAVDDC